MTNSTNVLVINKTQTTKLLFLKKAFQALHLKRLFYVQDVRYSAKSQGWRCAYAQEWPIYTLLLVSFSALPVHAENACTTPFSFDETVVVRHIYDGDTLRLSDGRNVRLIGINTPELARKQKPAEVFAHEAKQALKTLVKKGQSIHLIYGKDKKDRYDRTLAHTFLASGQNIQQKLLSQGLASAITIPPNIKFAACYLAVENTARCHQLGLWKNRAALKAKQLTNQHLGFQLIQGTVKNITTNAKGIWLNIDDTLTVGIRPDNQHLFDKKIINNYLNQPITIRGWLNKSRKSTPFYLRIKHPLSIQHASTLSCH
ncbi:hypothetical protein MNBD_GAMMA05-1791 [hydrothermal vent metagenome]|uniref:TNase-like domain-containing protein n=1 Tax=hydrothermal vent metagenome TaxID=652676 RepID=A0A3B0WQC1_9ZZZZ